MVTKKRHRLGPGRVENLLILKENGKLVEEYKGQSVRVLEAKDDAFQDIELEEDASLVVLPRPPPISDIFGTVGEEDTGDGDISISDESSDSDDEFEVVFD